MCFSDMSTVSLCSFNMSSIDAELAPADDKKRNVVVAMDDSEHATYALDWYKHNLHRSTDYVYLIHSVEFHHVVHNNKWHYLPQHNNVDTVGPLIKEEHVILQTRLDKYNAQLKELEIQGEAKSVQAKSPGEAVVKAADDVGAAVIVTGTRGMGTVRRTILGSVSDYILHHASVPVIVCHKHHKKH